jgi:flavin reductase
MSLERPMTDGAVALSVHPATKERFRDGMARLAAAVNIVTSDGPAGLAGFTATAVCSVTDQPPTLIVCLNRSASVYDTVTTNGVIAVNVLGAHHVSLSNLFGGKTPVEERFAAAAWTRGETGAPLLADALTAFDCRITDAIDVGTHKVLICTVVGVAEHGGDTGLTYFGRAYHVVGGVA